MTEAAYAGQSLRFVRMLLRCPARWATAKEASDCLTLQDLPLVFSVSSVLFYDAARFGHCGLYVGSGRAITVDIQGSPVLLPAAGDCEHYWGGSFLGWISAEAFAKEAGA